MHYHHFYRQGHFLKYGYMPISQKVQDYFAYDPRAEGLIEYAETWYTNHPEYRDKPWDQVATAIANDLNLKDFV